MSVLSCSDQSLMVQSCEHEMSDLSSMEMLTAYTGPECPISMKLLSSALFCFSFCVSLKLIMPF